MVDHSEFYREEARELVEDIEQKLLELEARPEDAELLNAIFRDFHTIKGSGSMFGFDAVAEFTHEIESMFDLLREKELVVNRQIIDLSLAAKDHIHDLIFEEDKAQVGTGEAILRDVRHCIDTVRPSRSVLPTQEENPTEEKTSWEEDTEEVERTFRIKFTPRREFFLRGARILPLLSELEALGRVLVFSHTDEVPPLDEIDPELSYCDWTILLTISVDKNALMDVFIFVEEYSEVKIDLIDDSERIDITTDYKRIGEILYEQGYIDHGIVESIMREKERFGDIAVRRGLLSHETVDSALAEQQYIRKVRQERRQRKASTTIRVKSERLDSLINLVGEIVTLQARLTRYTERVSLGDEVSVTELENVAENMARLTAELRENTMDIRMVPLAETFNGFYRLVRDLSADLGKEIKLETYGAETELDKNIIDALKDPLVHIIRNSIDHGIENPEERIQAGKDGTGLIVIRAEHFGANVVIRIEDDGRGLDRTKIRRKAIQKGLISEDEKISDHDAAMLIFTPGFSTAETATSVSGRGVGMDVVKRNIEHLRGKIDIDSVMNNGTGIILTIPLTLSIIDGLLIAVGTERYIINLSAVEECFELTSELLPEKQRNEYLSIRGVLVPYIDLRRLFGVRGAVPANREVAVVRTGNNRVGLIVDSIISQHQTVIKPLSPAFGFVKEVSGTTILGDGSIAFILDINKITERTTIGSLL